MLDTLMVLWTRGYAGRFLRGIILGLLFLIATVLLLFVMMISGIRWPGLAFSGGPIVATTAKAPFSSTDLPTILQNPHVPSTDLTASPPATSVVTRHSVSQVQRTRHQSTLAQPGRSTMHPASTPTVIPTVQPAPTPTLQATSVPTPTLTVQPTFTSTIKQSWLNPFKPFMP